MYNIYRLEHLGSGILTLQLNKKIKEKSVGARQFNRPSGFIYTYIMSQKSYMVQKPKDLRGKKTKKFTW